MLCSGPVGLDIQTPDPLPGERLARIAARFHPGEAAALAAAPEAARPAAFYRLWAMKESVMKLSGDGFALPLKSFRVIPRGLGGETALSDGRKAAILTMEIEGLVLSIARWRGPAGR